MHFYRTIYTINGRDEFCMVSAYCLDYHNWVCIPRHIREDFAEMKDMGFDAVDLSFSESEERYALRTFEILIELAHEAGLKVNVIPSRIAGRFAGAPLMASNWLVKNTQYQVPNNYYLPVACVECDEVRDWVKQFMHFILTNFDIDGIIWDEPKAVDMISLHPATIAKYGENPTAENMMDGYIDFFNDIAGYCRELRPDVEQTLFCMPADPEYFTSRISKSPYIDYFGYDGNLSNQRRFKEEIHYRDKRIYHYWDRTLKETADACVKTFALVETMHMPREEHENFEKNFDDYLATHRPDHLSVYYYGHNADDPEALNEIVKRVMKKHLKKENNND